MTFPKEVLLGAIPEQERFIDVYVPYVIKLLESKPKNVLDIYRFSTYYFENELKKRKGVLEEQNFEISERNRKSYKEKSPKEIYKRCGYCNVPNECDFIYDSVIELHPVHATKVNECGTPLTPLTVENLQNTAQSEWTKRIHSIYVDLHNLHLNFVKMLETIHQEMDSGNSADKIPDNSFSKINCKLKKEQVSKMSDFEINKLSPSKTTLTDNTCNFTRFKINQAEKLKTFCKNCTTLENARTAEKLDPQYILHVLKSAKEVIDSIKITLFSHRIKNKVYSTYDSKQLRTIPISSLGGLNSSDTAQLLTEEERNTVSKTDNKSKYFKPDISEAAVKSYVKNKLQSEKYSKKECPKHLGEFKNVLDIGPKGYDSESIFKAFKQKDITHDKEMPLLANNSKPMPKSNHESNEKNELSSDLQQFNLKTLAKRKVYSDIANDRYYAENKSLSKSPKTLSFEKAFGFRSVYTDAENIPDLKTKEKSAFADVQQDSFIKKSSNWARDHVVLKNLRQSNAVSGKYLIKEATSRPYVIKDDLIYIDEPFDSSNLVWKRVFEDYV